MSDKVRIKIISLREEENIEKLVEALENLGVSISEFFRSVSAGKPFVFEAEREAYRRWKNTLDKLCYYQEEPHVESLSPLGFTAVALLDTFFVFSLSEWFSKSLNLEGVASGFFASQMLLWSFISIFKLFIAFLLYAGFGQNLETTPVGYLLKIRVSNKDTKVFISFMLIPIAGILLVSSPFGSFAKLFGLFLFAFFVGGCLSGLLTSHYRLRIERA
ncbi:hypothetical protein [Hydrogenobacter hydrogenophilus]|uniref:Uncharacterized protein n=1 Tax=Hydrogenobacter hydrogenophilus TaxID=35835 RepID=A0A285P141_9AQUI|nr:hypothetical protein [Hydrogenobacter hydrogenophilus]SNZ14997.1 hypothetical protein SAMN06265353_1250 [Hydrogenobacter hydrogenophilus]